MKKGISCTLLILFSLLMLLPFLGRSQATYTAPIGYNTGAPTAAPSGVGTRWRFDLLTGKKYTWNPDAMAWDEDPRGIDQISGCSAPMYTPGYNQSTFAVNSCTPTPELYQYTGSSWVKLNGGGSYTAGANIDITGNVISLTGNLPVERFNGGTNAASNTYWRGDGLWASLPSAITSLNGLSPSIQTFATSTAGTDFSIQSFGSTHTFRLPTASATNRGALSSADWTTFDSKDPSTTNELNTSISVSGSNLQIVDAGGTLTVPVSSIAPVQAVSAGSGINIAGTTTRTISAVDVSATNEIQTLSIAGQDISLSLGGGTVTIPAGADGNGIYSGSGTIPDGTAAKIGSEFGVFKLAYFNNNTALEIDENGLGGLGIYSIDGQSAFQVYDGGFTFSNTTDDGGIAFGLTDAEGFNFGDGRAVKIGMTYAAEYPDILTNDRSIPDVGLTKTLISSENGALGTGFTEGGGAGTIPNGTVATSETPEFVFTMDGTMWEQKYDDGAGTTHLVNVNNRGLRFFSDNGTTNVEFVIDPENGAFSANGSIINFGAVNGGSVTIESTGQIGLTVSSVDGTLKVFDNNATTLGMQYVADYSATIITNPTSITDVTSVNLLIGQKAFNANHTATGTATTAFTVTLPTTQPDATYSVSIMPKNALSATGWYISARTTTDFTVTYLTALTGAVDFDYIIVN